MVMGDYTAHRGYVAPTRRPPAPRPRPWRCGRSPVWLGPAACAARWAVHGPRGRGRGGAGARRARGELGVSRDTRVRERARLSRLGLRSAEDRSPQTVQTARSPGLSARGRATRGEGTVPRVGLCLGSGVALPLVVVGLFWSPESAVPRTSAIRSGARVVP